MYAILPAAGTASRMGDLCAEKSKIFLPIFEGKSVLELTLNSLLDSGVIAKVLIVARQRDFEEIQGLAAKVLPRDFFEILEGGDTRQESVGNGLKRALEAGADYVLVHDAARCFCPPEDIRKVAAEAQSSNAAILAVPAISSIKKVQDGVIVDSIPRAEVWEAQTPQVFATHILNGAHQKAEADAYVGTDESELVQRIGVAVSVVEGSRKNIKVTTPEDLDL